MPMESNCHSIIGRDIDGLMSSYPGFHLGTSSWGDHVAGEGRVDFIIIIIGNILGGKLGQFGTGGKLSCLGGKLPLRLPP